MSEASGVKVLHKGGCTLQAQIPFNITYEDYVLPNKESIGKSVKDVITSYSQMIATIKILKKYSFIIENISLMPKNVKEIKINYFPASQLTKKE